MSKPLEEKVEEIDKVIDNISHNRMLHRNWERMKLLMIKKEEKKKAEQQGTENKKK